MVVMQNLSSSYISLDRIQGIQKPSTIILSRKVLHEAYKRKNILAINEILFGMG